MLIILQFHPFEMQISVHKPFIFAINVYTFIKTLAQRALSKLFLRLVIINPLAIIDLCANFRGIVVEKNT